MSAVFECELLAQPHGVSGGLCLALPFISFIVL